MQGELRPSPSIFRGIIASSIFAAFFGALALSVLPQWHEWLHADAKAPFHECAVTLVSAGTYHEPAPVPLVVAPAPALQFSFVVALHPVWVASPFISARVFEHAPPVIA